MFFCTRYYGELLFALYQANGKLKTRAGKQAAKNMLVRNLNDRTWAHWIRYTIIIGEHCVLFSLLAYNSCLF